ncbi:reverse transcriptase [Canna indica]|uniref:Reverse transcriptase n=1 Tax=Canna indica TaxID=4628 RepID=A0AAQ3KQP0_9LILI|nr:reverse transcriptase [Canna indica]
MGGDFNITIHMGEQANCVGNTIDSRRFSRTIADPSLIDLPLSGSPFTWTNNQPPPPPPPALAKLDRILINSNMALAFPELSGSVGDRRLFDHNPLVFRMALTRNKPRAQFRIENNWLLCDHFGEIIKAWLCSTGTDVTTLVFPLRQLLELSDGDTRSLSPTWRKICNLLEILRPMSTLTIGCGRDFRLSSRLPLFRVYSWLTHELETLLAVLPDGTWTSDTSSPLLFFIDSLWILPLSYMFSELQQYRGGGASQTQTYSTKLIYHLLNYQGVEDPKMTFLWQKECPPIFSMHTWLVEQRRLPTRDKLIARGFSVSLNCALCNIFAETHEHLFSACAYTTEGWKLFLTLSSTSFFFPWTTNLGWSPHLGDLHLVESGSV